MPVPDYLSRQPVNTESQRASSHPWLGAFDLKDARPVPAQEQLRATAQFLTHQVFTNLFPGWEKRQWADATDLSPSLLAELQQEDPLLAALTRHSTRPSPPVSETTAYLLDLCNAQRPVGKHLTHLPPNWLGAELDDFEMHNGVLFVRRQNRLLLVVPTALRLLFLEEKHDSHQAAHSGTNRTLRRIEERYWWPNLRRDVEEYIGGCVKCLQTSTRRGRWSYGFANPLPVVYRPFERVSLDILTVTEDNSTRFHKVLLMVDHSTRYAEAVPLPTGTAEQVAEALYSRIYERYGPINVLLTDNGSEFTAELLTATTKGLYEAMGAHHVTISPRHPQTNGVTERLNSTLLKYLRVLTEKRRHDWHQHLSAAIYAYNTTHQTALGASPYLLMYGRDPVDALDQWIDDALELQPTPVSPDDWNFKLQQARQRAQEHLLQQQQHASDRADRSRRDPAPAFTPGTYVYWRPRLMDERSSKLKYRGTGQVMRIQELRGNHAFLETLKGSVQRANVSDLFPLRSRRPYHRINLYEVLRSMLHRNPVVEPDRSWNGVPLDHDDDIPWEQVPDVSEEPATLLPSPSVAPTTEVSSADSPTIPVTVTELQRPATPPALYDPMPPLENHSPVSPHRSSPPRIGGDDSSTEFCVPDRILQLESILDSHGRRRRMVQLGYVGYPDDPVIEPWYDYDDLAEDGKVGWLADWKRRGGRNLITSRRRDQHRQQLARVNDELAKLECEEEEDFIGRQRITQRRRDRVP
jgi:transposase InsO family protein